MNETDAESLRRRVRGFAISVGGCTIGGAIVILSLFFMLKTPAADSPSEPTRPTPQEMDTLTGVEGPKTLTEQVLEAVSDDSLVVRSVDGRTVLMMEGQPDAEFTLSFSNVVDGVAANVKLGKGGLQHRFTLVKPKGAADTPIYLDLVGPSVNGGAGVKITIRF